MLPYGCSWHRGGVDVCDFLCLLPVHDTKCAFNLDLVFVNIAKIKFFFYSHKLFTEILQCDGEKEIKAEVNYINYKFA